MNKSTFIHATAVLALLSACGGGGSDAEIDTGVPVTATASPEAFSSYAGALAVDDRAEPREVNGVLPPTSETAEPVDVT